MKIYINYEFDDWNTYIEKERSNKYWANQRKKEEEKIVKLSTIGKKYNGKYPVKMTFIKYFKDKRKDIDGVRVKSIIDGLVRCGVLKNDNLNCINSIQIIPKFDKIKEGIEIIIEEN